MPNSIASRRCLAVSRWRGASRRRSAARASPAKHADRSADRSNPAPVRACPGASISSPRRCSARATAADTLIGGPRQPEKFVVRDDGFDCVTFCETVLAAADAHDLASFETQLRAIRYRNGVVDWRERNHDFAAWCARNVANGLCHALHSAKRSTSKNRRLAAPAWPPRLSNRGDSRARRCWPTRTGLKTATSSASCHGGRRSTISTAAS